MRTICCLLLLGIAPLSGAVITAASCSQPDFEAAYYGSHPGDTVILPTGSGTWGAASNKQPTLYISNTYSTDIRGQGDDTVITLADDGPTYANGVIWIGSPAVFQNMKIIGSNTRPVTAFAIVPFNGFTGAPFRIAGITYVGGSSDGYFVYVQSGVNNGVIDHCTVTGNSGSAELIFGKGPSTAWQSNNTFGTADNIFIEDCTFNNTGYVCDANANARFVVRFNTINGSNKIDGHGLASNSPARSVRNMEVYGNTWTMAGAGNWADIEVRGGTCLIFNNSSTAGWFFLHEYAYDAEPHGWPNFGIGGTITAGNPTIVTTNGPHGYSTGWPVWVQAPLGVIYGMYNITVTGTNTFTLPVSTTANETIDFATAYKTPRDYPIKDQIGMGKDGGVREPAYVFGNTQGGNPWVRNLGTVCADAIAFYRAQSGNGSVTFTERDVIQVNRDFFSDAGFDMNSGVSVGTSAQMHAMTPSITGYGFWVTDEGEWNSRHTGPDGRLYVWNGNAWVLSYTPYTYPHPATSNGVTKPSAPTNLRRVSP